MSTVREYFDTDARAVTIHKPWFFAEHEADPNRVEVTAKVAYDFEANAKYWYFYVPTNADLSTVLSLIIDAPEFKACQLGPDGDGVYMEVGHSDTPYDRQSTRTLQFTRRAHLYVDFEVSPSNRTSLFREAEALGFFVTIRDREYARTRATSEKPLAFISHDSRDKDAFVRELAHELSKISCPVWYDEYSLKVGDSLRASIEQGLKQAKRCVVILSPNFFANKGWGLAEYDSIFSREILEKKNVILPVWLNVGVGDVFDYSPRLADKVGIPASLGAEEVARRLAVVIRAAPADVLVRTLEA